MWHHWPLHQHHVMPKVSSMASLHSLGEDNWNQVKRPFWLCDVFGAGIFASHDAKRILNGTSASLRLRQSKWHVAWLLRSHDATAISIHITWYHWHWCCHVILLHWCQHHVMWTALSMAPLHYLGQENQNEVQHDSFGHVHYWHHFWHYFDSVVSCTTTFLWSRQSKWGATWLFAHLIPLALTSVLYNANSIINNTIRFLKLWPL